MHTKYMKCGKPRNQSPMRRRYQSPMSPGRFGYIYELGKNGTRVSIHQTC